MHNALKCTKVNLQCGIVLNSAKVNLRPQQSYKLLIPAINSPSPDFIDCRLILSTRTFYRLSFESSLASISFYVTQYSLGGTFYHLLLSTNVRLIVICLFVVLSAGPDDTCSCAKLKAF